MGNCTKYELLYILAPDQMPQRKEVRFPAQPLESSLHFQNTEMLIMVLQLGSVHDQQELPQPERITN